MIPPQFLDDDDMMMMTMMMMIRIVMAVIFTPGLGGLLWSRSHAE